MVSGQYVMTAGILSVVWALFDFNDLSTTDSIASGPATVVGLSHACSFKSLLVVFQFGVSLELRV